MGANSSQTKPDHETQLRPLTGLTLEQAQVAWEKVVARAGGQPITARLVKSAMRELHLGSDPKPVSQIARMARADHRRLIDDAIGELIMLASQKARYDTLTAKVELLHQRIQSLFATQC